MFFFKPKTKCFEIKIKTTNQYIFEIIKQITNLFKFSKKTK